MPIKISRKRVFKKIKIDIFTIKGSTPKQCLSILFTYAANLVTLIFQSNSILDFLLFSRVRICRWRRKRKRKKEKKSNRQRTFFITQRCPVHSWGTFSHTYSCTHIRTFPEILPSLFCYSRSSLAINMACIKIRTVNTTLTCDSSDCVLALHFLARIMWLGTMLLVEIF